MICIVELSYLHPSDGPVFDVYLFYSGFSQTNMLPEPVWTELEVSGAQRPSNLLVSARVLGRSSQLSPRVSGQY